MKTKLALSILLLTLLFSFEKGMAQAPAWAWAKSAGGIENEWANGIAIDANGNVLVTGYIGSDSVTFGTTTLFNAGGPDVFIVKYNATGNVLWAKSVGGTSDDAGNGIATDTSGNVLVTGYFYSDSITFGTTTLFNAGSKNIFVVKYDASGNVLWATSAGGTSYDEGSSISSDANGNVLVTGGFNSYIITFGTTTLIKSNGSGSDIFVVKYDASGNVLWAKSEGGNSSDDGCGITSDASGNVLVTGNFSSDSITFGTTTLTNANVGPGYSDIFMVKYDSLGNVLWAKSTSGTYNDNCRRISTDASGNILVTGDFASDTITLGTTTLVNANGPYSDIFIVKYDPSGNVIWAKSEGGNSHDYGWGISTDASENVVVSGHFGSNSITFGTTTLINSGGQDIFIVKYNASGNVLWAKCAGGIGYDMSYALATNAIGTVLVTGFFASPSINFGTTTLTNGGSGDIFIAKLDGTTGIEDASTSLSMASVFPNPATDYLTINTGNNKEQVITISDITGKIIYSITTLADKTIINTKDFSQGVYAVQVQAGDAVETRKIVVTR